MESDACVFVLFYFSIVLLFYFPIFLFYKSFMLFSLISLEWIEYYKKCKSYFLISIYRYWFHIQDYREIRENNINHKKYEHGIRERILLHFTIYVLCIVFFDCFKFSILSICYIIFAVYTIGTEIFCHFIFNDSFQSILS